MQPLSILGVLLFGGVVLFHWLECNNLNNVIRIQIVPFAVGEVFRTFTVGAVIVPQLEQVVTAHEVVVAILNVFLTAAQFHVITCVGGDDGVLCSLHGSGDCEFVKEILEVIHGAELIRVYHVFENYGVAVFDVLKGCARGDGVLCVLHGSKVISF